MGNAFGKRFSPTSSSSSSSPSSSPAISDHDRAVLELKRQRDRCARYAAKLDLVINRETQMAKQLLQTGNKEKAILALKKKKYQQGLLQNTQEQLNNLQTLVDQIEFAAVQQQVFAALKEGNSVLTRLNDETRIEDVEQLMSETAESVEYVNKVSQLLGSSLTEQDQSAVDEEFERLQAETLREEMSSLPTAPVGTHISTGKQEEKRTEQTEKANSKKEVVHA